MSKHKLPVETWDAKLDAALWVRLVLGFLTIVMFGVLGLALALFLEGVAK